MCESCENEFALLGFSKKQICEVFLYQNSFRLSILARNSYKWKSTPLQLMIQKAVFCCCRASENKEISH